MDGGWKDTDLAHTPEDFGRGITSAGNWCIRLTGSSNNKKLKPNNKKHQVKHVYLRFSCFINKEHFEIMNI